VPKPLPRIRCHHPTVVADHADHELCTCSGGAGARSPRAPAPSHAATTRPRPHRRLPSPACRRPAVVNDGPIRAGYRTVRSAATIGACSILCRSCWSAIAHNTDTDFVASGTPVFARARASSPVSRSDARGAQRPHPDGAGRRSPPQERDGRWRSAERAPGIDGRVRSVQRSGTVMSGPHLQDTCEVRVSMLASYRVQSDGVEDAIDQLLGRDPEQVRGPRLSW
jgi:hypothetical protein